MRGRGIFAVSLAILATALPVLADRAGDIEPVLRLRLSDPLLDAAPKPLLRPRFSDRAMAVSSSVPDLAVSVERSGRIGNFAFISTPHPNLVIAVGATEDRSEIGRQMDRAIMDMAPDHGFYSSQQDKAPFIGVGVRTGQGARGWTFDASIGAGLLNSAETARLSDWTYGDEARRFDAEARGNMRLRYRF